MNYNQLLDKECSLREIAYASLYDVTVNQLTRKNINYYYNSENLICVITECN